MILKIPKYFKYNDFTGGYNSYSSPSNVADSESPNLRNMRPFGNGGVEKIPGTVLVGNDVDDNVSGLGSFYKTEADGTVTRKLIRVSGGNLKYLNSNSWTTISGVSYTPNKNANFVQVGNILLIHDEVDPMSKYDGTTLSNPANGIVAAFGIEFRGYHWCAGNKQNPDTLYRSTATDPADFIGSSPDTGETYRVGLGDGQKITGLCKWGEYLVIFKERSTYYLTMVMNDLGEYVTTIKLVNPVIGCVAHRTIDNVDNDVYFLSYEGVYVLGNEPNYFNVIRTKELSAKISNMVRNLQPNRLKNSAGIYNDHRYRLAVPEGGSNYNNLELVIERRYSNSWWVNRGRNINCYNEYIDQNESFDLYYGDDNAGKTMMFDEDIDGDDGVAITSVFNTKRFDQGDQGQYKRYKDIWLEFKESTGIVKIEVFIDGEIAITDTPRLDVVPSNAGWGTGLWGSLPRWGRSIDVSSSGSVEDTRIIHYRIDTIGRVGRNIQVRVTQSTSDSRFRLTSVKIKAFLKSEWNFYKRYQ